MPRQILFTGIAILLASLFTGCATTSQSYSTGETQRGYASWYGAENGNRTASGERFNWHKLTAAHRHLPFGTIVRVTNEQNGKSVEVRINDRGPWSGGRIIDLSSEAADEIDMKSAGVVPVEVRIVFLGTGACPQG